MDHKESFGTKCGRWLANLFFGCAVACLSAILIALTVRFIMWIM